MKDSKPIVVSDWYVPDPSEYDSPSIDHPIFDACRQNDFNKLKNYIDSGISHLARNSAGNNASLLHYASGYNCYDIVSYLLNNFTTFCTRDDEGLSPLHNASAYGHTRILELLLEHNFDIDQQDNWGYTALHQAACNRQVDACLFLCRKGGSIHLKDENNKTPLDFASHDFGDLMSINSISITLHNDIRKGDWEDYIKGINLRYLNAPCKEGRCSTPLHLAAGYNRIKICRDLLSRGANVLAQDKGGLIPLHNACSYGHLEICKILLDHRPKYPNNYSPAFQLDARDLYNYTPLHEAVYKGRTDVCSLLIGAGANHWIDTHDEKLNVFNICKDPELSAHLRYCILGRHIQDYFISELSKFNSIKFFDRISKRTSPHLNPFNEKLALPAMNIDKIKAYIAYLITSSHIRNENDPFLYKNAFNGNTLLHSLCSFPNMLYYNEYLARSWFVHILLILSNVPVDTNNSGKRPDDLFDNEKYPAMKKVLSLNLYDKFMTIPSKIEMLKTAMKLPFPLCFQSLSNQVKTPLLHQAIVQKIRPLPTNLISEVNAKDFYNITPLHVASIIGDLDAVNFLLQNGADVFALDDWKNHPINYASKYLHHEVYKKLAICKSLTVAISNVFFEYPIAFHKFSMDPWDGKEKVVNHEELINAARTGDLSVVKRNWDPKSLCKDPQGRQSTPLHIAAGYCHEEIVEYLIKNGADINARDKGGLIPLHNACSYGHLSIVSLLINNGAKVNAQDNWGFTPLHEAAQKGRTQICSLLLFRGADPMICNDKNETPLDLATADDIIALLFDVTLAPKLAKIKISLNVRDDDDDEDEEGSKVDFSRLCDMRNFLKSINLDQYADYFQKKKISLKSLFQISERKITSLEKVVKPKDLCILRYTLDSLKASSLQPLIMATQPTLANNKNLSMVTTSKILFPHEADFIKVELLMQSTIKKHIRSDVFSAYRIIQVTSLSNAKLLLEYSFRQKVICEENEGDPNERLLFHGSPFVDSIVNKGFDERHANISGMFGAGIYFADVSSKSNQYVFGANAGCRLHADADCYICPRKLLLCKVTLGKTFVQTTSVKLAHAPPGHHSITGSPGQGLAHPEFVVYRGEQAYPVYLIEYKIIKPGNEGDYFK